MKRIVDEYFKIIVYTIFGLIFVMSSYLIIINIHHYRALSSYVIVSEADSDYVKYKKNVNDIDDILNKSLNNTYLKNTSNVLKKGGVFRLVSGDKLSYHDLYNLNNYLLYDLINDCWISKLRTINKKREVSEVMDGLVKNTKYLNNHFINNGLIMYDSFDESMIQEEYQNILKNYLIFSNIILDMSKGE